MSKSRVLYCIGLGLLAMSTLLSLTFPARAADKTEIVVGTPLPLTGGIAENGKEELWAYEAAVKDVNAKGGIFVKQYNKKLPVRLVVADAESDPGKAAAAFERLVKVDKVDLMLSSCTGNLVMPTAVAADKLHVYYHASSCFPFQWRQLKAKWSTLYFFELAQGADIPYEVLNSIPQDKRPKKFALLMEDSLDGRNFDKGLRESAKKYKYDIVMTEFLGVGSKDYSASILKLKTAGIDSVMVLCADADAITFVRQMKEANYNIPFFLGNKGTVSADFYNALGKDAGYIMSDGFWTEDWPFPGAKELGQRYRKQFNKDSTAIGFYYALCQALWVAIEKAGTLDGAKVRQAVLTTEFKNTVNGDIKYNPDGTAIFPNGVLQWTPDGQRKTVYPFNMSNGYKVALAPPWNERK